MILSNPAGISSSPLTFLNPELNIQPMNENAFSEFLNPLDPASTPGSPFIGLEGLTSDAPDLGNFSFPGFGMDEDVLTQRPDTYPMSSQELNSAQPDNASLEPAPNLSMAEEVQESERTDVFHLPDHGILSPTEQEHFSMGDADQSAEDCLIGDQPLVQYGTTEDHHGSDGAEDFPMSSDGPNVHLATRVDLVEECNNHGNSRTVEVELGDAPQESAETDVTKLVMYSKGADLEPSGCVNLGHSTACLSPAADSETMEISSDADKLTSGVETKDVALTMDTEDLGVSGTFAGNSGVSAGSSGVSAGSSGVSAGSSGLSAGSSGLSAGSEASAGGSGVTAVKVPDECGKPTDTGSVECDEIEGSTVTPESGMDDHNPDDPQIQIIQDLHNATIEQKSSIVDPTTKVLSVVSDKHQDTDVVPDISKMEHESLDMDLSPAVIQSKSPKPPQNMQNASLTGACGDVEVLLPVEKQKDVTQEVKVATEEQESELNVELAVSQEHEEDLVPEKMTDLQKDFDSVSPVDDQPQRSTPADMEEDFVPTAANVIPTDACELQPLSDLDKEVMNITDCSQDREDTNSSKTPSSEQGSSSVVGTSSVLFNEAGAENLESSSTSASQSVTPSSHFSLGEQIKEEPEESEAAYGNELEEFPAENSIKDEPGLEKEFKAETETEFKQGVLVVMLFKSTQFKYINLNLSYNMYCILSIPSPSVVSVDSP